MSNSDVILIFLIMASAFLILCLSFVTVVKRDKKRINSVNGLIFFLYGAIHLCDTGYREGTEYLTAHLIHVNTPLVFFLGPVLYLYFLILLHEDFKIKTRHYLLFIPGILVFLGLLPFYFLDAPTKLAIYPFYTSSRSSAEIIYFMIKNAGALIIFISFLLALRSTFFLWNKKARAHITIIRRILLYLVAWVFLAGVFTIAGITGNIHMYRIASLTGNFLLFLYFLFTCRDPDFFSKVQKESNEIKYINSKLRNIDKKKILTELEELLTKEKIYRDSSLNLNKLSMKLDISSAQLSELLNSHYHSSFSNFINSYRIEEVKIILGEERDINILEAAFGCGFNSKTTFNTAFRKSTGLTPSQFRKEKGTDI